MEIEKLLKLRNTLFNSQEGQILIEYCSDYITENSCKSRDAAEIKGMCELLQQIKLIPTKVESLRKS